MDPMTAMWPAVLIPVALVVLVVVAGRRVDERRVRRLRRDGRTVGGYVTDLGYDRGDDLGDGAHYWAEVSYGDEWEHHSTRVTLTRGRYDSLRRGAKVSVTYLPGRPRSARLLG